jgi:hypothetical protein
MANRRRGVACGEAAAGLLNPAANACFAVGIAAPIVAACFAGSFDYRRMISSISGWFGAVVLAHSTPRHVFSGLLMAKYDFLAFVYLPLLVGGAAWASAWWVRKYLK